MTAEDLAAKAHELLDLDVPGNPLGDGTTVRGFLADYLAYAWSREESSGLRAIVNLPAVRAGLAPGTLIGGRRLEDAFQLSGFDPGAALALVAEAARQMGERRFPQGARDVAGYCPVGCGPSLHLMPSGILRCLAPKCPRPAAASELLADRETEHVVLFEATGHTVRHPLRERLDAAANDLFTCPVHEMCCRLPGPPGGITGRYRARVKDGGLDLEFLEAPGARN